MEYENNRREKYNNIYNRQLAEDYLNSILKVHDLRVENERLRGLIKMMHSSIDIDRFIHKDPKGNIEW